MSNQTLNLSDKLYAYLLGNSLREPAVLQALREETSAHDMSVMQISPEQGQFFALLVKLLDIRRVIEVGVFTGYSSLAMALAMPEGGKILACDINKQWTDVARKFWQQAGVADKIDLKLGRATSTLQSLIEAGEVESYDFAFIDADKVNYKNYFEACLELIKPGGLIAIDNVLWGGAVIDAEDNTEDTQAIRQLNDDLLKDQRIDLSMLPLGDGLTLARKRY